MITTREFGNLPTGETVMAYDFRSEAGFKATILSYGATLQSLVFPDGTDVVLGFDDLESYLSDHPYFGCIIGRVANRIGGAGFEIDGERFSVPANENGNNLHAGPVGFDRVNWIGEIEDGTLILSHTSPDGHQGFPGELLTELRFKFEGSKLSLDIQAAANKPCPVNITWHPYFNLTDGGKTACTDHQLQISAEYYTPTDSANIPTGKLECSSDDVAYNYTTPNYVNSDDKLDQNFVFKTNENEVREMTKMAKLSSDTSGRKVIICSTEPCLQAYTGAFIPKLTGKTSIAYGPNHGVALEPQGYPDGINHDGFPSHILRPGEVYSHKINYTFRT